MHDVGKCVICLVGLLTCANCCESTFGWTDEPLIKLQQQFDANIVPILKTKCAPCHFGEEANAGISFDSFQNIEQVLNADRKWSSVKNEIVSESMPPEDEPQLTAAEAKKLTQWIDDVFRLIDCETINPGNVTIRKLTRYEFRNSVRELFGVDYVAADQFPGDDVGHGFDNVADVLSLPPVLFERYLDAAEDISHQVIFDPAKLALDISLAANSFEFDKENTQSASRKLVIFTEGQITRKIHFPEFGAYALAIRAYGDQAGDEDVQMSLFVDGKKIDTVAVTNTKRRSKRYVFRIPILSLGTRRSEFDLKTITTSLVTSVHRIET